MGRAVGPWSGGLVPKVSFVEGDVLCQQKIAEFVLEGLFLVVLFLGGDVLLQGGEVGGVDGEDAVAALPGEVWNVRFEEF